MNTKMNRRKFLGMSALAGGALLVPSACSSTATATREIKEEGKIPTRLLGKTGLRIPILSMGVMRADNPAVVRAAYNSGLTHFDTAHGYQNGRNEEMLGAFFKDKDRSSFTIATKAKPRLNADSFEKDFEEQLNISLNRLQMDYVDIFYAHGLGDLESISNARLIAQLKKFKADGKIKHIGFSTHAQNWRQIDEAIKTGIYEVILLNYNFKMNDLDEWTAALERGTKAGIGFVAMKTMVGGAEDAAGEKQIDGAACLRWVWQNPNITTAIPGFTRFDLLDNCLEAALQPELGDADRSYLASLCDQEMLYCKSCGQCVGQCRKSLPIPDIMRAYMYNTGYHYPSMAKETLLELALTGEECSDCSGCTVQCPSGFNIAEKISTITPIMNVPNHFLT